MWCIFMRRNDIANYINVIEGESEHIVMQTPGNTKAAYYLMVKPIN